MSNKIMYTTTEVQQLLNDGNVTLVDVRDAEEYAEDHIPGAVNIPEMFYELSMTTEECLREMTDKFKNLSNDVLGTACEEVLHIITSLEERPVNDLIELLRPND